MERAYIKELWPLLDLVVHAKTTFTSAPSRWMHRKRLKVAVALANPMMNNLDSHSLKRTIILQRRTIDIYNILDNISIKTNII